MSSLIRFYPGDRGLDFLLVVTLGAALASSAAWLISRRLAGKAALRHLVLFSALVCCLAFPAVAWFYAAADLTLVSIPILREEDRMASWSTQLETDPVWMPPRQSTDPPPVAAGLPLRHTNTTIDQSADVAAPRAADQSPVTLAPSKSDVQPTGGPAVTRVSFRGVATAAMFVWAAGALLMLARLARNCWRVVQLRRSSRPMHDEGRQSLLGEISAKLGMRQVPLLLVSSRTVVPLAVGFGRPAIILPERLLGAVSDNELRDVLMHEAAHLERGDQRIVLLQKLAGVLYWPIVSVHALNRELQRAREEVCDNVVLASRDAINYGKTLLHVAELLVQARPLSAAVGIIGRQGELERRIAGLIDPRRNTTTTTGRKTVCVVMLLFIAGVAITSATRFAASAAAEEASLGAEDGAQEPEAKAAESAKTSHHPDEQVEIPFKDSGADVSLELDKPEYFLGENVVLYWHIRNAGVKPLAFETGGDERTPGAKRAIRFKVEALDTAGEPVPDPYPNPPNFGGWGGGPTLEPGQDFWKDLQLMRYREFTAPGEYTIKVYHDLGWEDLDPEETFARRAASDTPPAPRKAPVVTTTIRFVMPSAAQARQVVDAMLAMPDDADRSWGKKGEAYADFELLRYPVYLPIAKELAQKGDPRGLDAIGAMAFPEATAALLELMAHDDAAVAAKAGDLLLARTSYIHDVPPSRRSYLVDRSWTDQLKKSAMGAAWKLLASDDRAGVIRGARLVQSLGAKDDLPALIEVMDRVLVKYKDNEVEQQAYLRPPNASGSLADASWALVRRGAQPPDSVTTPGSAVAWLAGLGVDENFRPDGWRETARSLIQHEIPFIRDVALRNLPLPLDETAVALVAEAIKDDFAPVQGAACELASKAKLEAFGPPLIDVLKSTKNDWVLRAAFRAAAECGVENDRRLEICVRRMEPRTNDWNMLLLSLLINGAIETNGYSSRAIDDWTSILPGIQTAWLDFIGSHRQELREGMRFKVGAPPLTPKMFPPGFSADGTPPAGSPPPSSQPDDQISDKPTGVASDSDAKHRFAPLWMAVSKFLPDANAESAVPVPSASYAMIWQTEWQNEIDLSAEQKKALLSIYAKALADANQHTEHFKSLPSEEQEAQAKSWSGKPAPWRQQLDNEIRRQIEAVLTRRQLQTLKEFSFPIHAVGLLYDADVRREIGFGPDQEDRFRRLVKERLARFQEEYLKHADRVWGLLSRQQQAELPEVVKHQGPTSAVLSIAYHVGFDMDAMALGYPLLAEAPVRERLGLSAEQDQQLRAAMADAAARSRKILQEAPKPDPEADDKQRLEAILTPQQLTLLKEIDFRRQVVLALGYPEKKKTIGMTDQQATNLQRLNMQTHEQLYLIDREMVEKALEILTPRQRERVRAEIERRIGG